MKFDITEHYIKYLPFDTEIFGIKCGRLEINNDSLSNGELECILEGVKRQQIEHLVVKVPSEWIELCNLMENLDFRFKVCSLELESKILHKIDNIDGVDIYKGNNDCRLIEITEKAFSSGTRFHLEQEFTSIQVAELYKRWINSLINDRNVQVCVHLDGTKITGYVTVKLENGTSKKGHIGLFAVDKVYRGKGIGSKLLSALKSKLFDKVDLLSVTTESINYDALKAYVSNGFFVRRSWCVYHLNVSKGFY